MKQNNSFLAMMTAAAVLSFGFSGCASMGVKPSDQIAILPGDRVFLRVTPFDSTVKAELSRAGLDSAKIEGNLASELHYQLFLMNQEESPDSAGATLRISITLHHLQPGTGNSGDFVAISLLSNRKDGADSTQWEFRQPAKENVPVEFLALHLPRILAKEILAHVKDRPRRLSTGTNMNYPPPLILLH